MRTIVWLSEITAQDSAQVGSKALNLAAILRAGWPVPAGFCVTTAAYEEYVAANDLGERIQALLSLPASEVRAAAPRLQEAIRAGHMSAEVRTAIIGAYHQLTASAGSTPLPVAVRSSATAEDLPTASFAGQQATRLNVRNETQLLQAIRECWASLWSPHAVLYRAQRGLAQPPPAIAVLVQQMVDADAAGVAFSRHPITGQDRVVIEAAWGLGEAVVSGECDVDRYVASRETSLEIEPLSIAHKLRQRAMAVTGGLQDIEVPLGAQDARVLTPEQVRDVAQTVLALERHFRCPQDMEWAFAQGRLFILQSRPITAHVASFFTDVFSEDNDIWTAGFLNERFPLPVSPLGWSVVQELLEKLAFRDPLRYLGLRDVDQLRITKLYRGHPYVNMFVFQTLYKVFPDVVLPEDAYRYFPEGKTELRRQAPYPRSLFDPRFVLSMLRHFLQQPRVWSPWHNHRVWAAFTTRHEQRCRELAAEFRALRDEGGSQQRIWAVIEEAQGLNAELLALHRWSLTCADLTYTLLRRLVQSQAGPEKALKLCTRLETALPNKSVEIDRALHELAQMSQDSPAFAQAFADFLARYGHRSFHLDIYYPPFADEPAQVLDLLTRLQRAHQPQTGEESMATREQARQEAQQWMGSGPLGWLRRALLAHILHLTQSYMPLREEQRFYWQKTLALMRHLFLLLGQRMAEAGALHDHKQVFFLSKGEIEAYVHGQSHGKDYSTLAATRQQQFARLCREFEAAPAWSYPPFLCGNQPLEMTLPGREAQFQGQPISPGLARGRVVVVLSPHEFDQIQPGDVLVTRGVDPGWTPIFGLLSALVMEHGGQLSHGAVVAREYGLPTVAGIPGITQALHDGDVVVVDGLTGLVARESLNHTTT